MNYYIFFFLIIRALAANIDIIKKVYELIRLEPAHKFG
jgi:hypothetical protein